VNPVREICSQKVCSGGGLKPPSALIGDDHRLQAAVFSNVARIFLFAYLAFFAGAVSAQDLNPPAAATAADKVSLDIKGMDVVEVLKMLASKVRINVVVDKNVSGRVTVFVKDVSPSDAMRTILASNNLVLHQEGEVARIMTAQDYEQAYGQKYADPRRMLRLPLRYLAAQQAAGLLTQMKSGVGQIVVDEASGALIILETPQKLHEMEILVGQMDRPMETRIFDLNYAKCEKTAESVRDVLSANTGRLVVDTRANRLIVTDYPERLSRAEAVIAGLDQRTREVLIDAKIVQVNLTDKTSLGIDWEYVLNKKFSIQGMFGNVITTTGNKWTIGSLNPGGHNDYSAVIEALRTQGDTKILSAPRLAVVNNESARILVGSKQVYVTTTAVQGQSTTETAEAVNFVDVGVKLYVTPTIGADGFISIKVRPEVSAVTENYTTSTGNKIPIVETSETETTVLLEDGATLVIGGLMKDETVKTANKIPWVGNFPILGFLFRNTVSETRKTELVIFLTCRIMDFAAASPQENLKLQKS